MHERTCLECGAAFVPRYGTQVCCSDKCRRARKERLQAERNADRELHRLDPAVRKALGEEKKEKARRRAEFLAARDAAFAKISMPPPRITVNVDGSRTEWRGHGFGSRANASHIFSENYCR